MGIIRGLSKNDSSITMGEKLFLLTLDQKRGKLYYRSAFALKYAITASIIYELEKKNRITFEKEKLVVKDKTPTGDYFQSLILEKIIEISKDKKLNYWITKLASNYKDIKPQIFESLLNKGALRKKRDKNDNEIWNRYEIWNDTIYRRHRSELDKILLEKKNPDTETQILASLLWASRATGNIYREKNIRSEAKIQIEILSDDEKYSKNVRKCINAVRSNVIFGVFSLVGPIIGKLT